MACVTLAKSQPALALRSRVPSLPTQIILGIGGDSSDWAVGTFYEGVMTSGYATDATDQAVHENIVAAGYGK